MKRFLIILVLFLVPALAQAQCNGNFSANRYCGTGASGGAPGQQSFSGIGPLLALPQNQIFIGQASGLAATESMSQDCTIAATGLITCLKTNNVAFAPSATTDTTNATNIGSGTLNSARLPSPFTNGTRQGNTSAFTTYAGSAPINGHAATYDVNGNLQDGGLPFPTFNIISYGAVSGADTSSRNSNALANAITACQLAGGGTIWVPAGNYQFATGYTQTGSNCSFMGEGQGASILTYTGTGNGATIGPSSGSNIIDITYRSIQIACSAACTDVVLVRDVEESIVFDDVALNAAGFGAHALQLTSLTSSTGGSFSVHVINGSFIAGCTAACLYVNPGGLALTQAIFIDHTFFNGYATNALSITSSNGLFITNCRFEHHPGTSNTNPAVHVDTTSKVGIRNNYFEDDSNANEIEIGGGVQSLDIVGNYITLNVTAATATGVFAIKSNGSGASTSVNIKDNTFIAGGTIGKLIDFSAIASSQIHVEDNYVSINNATTVFDFGAATASKAISNSINVGTVTTGINSSVGQSALAVCGNTFSGTFTTQSGPAQCIAVTGTPTASFGTNWMGQVTHL